MPPLQVNTSKYIFLLPNHQHNAKQLTRSPGCIYRLLERKFLKFRIMVSTMIYSKFAYFFNKFLFHIKHLLSIRVLCRKVYHHYERNPMTNKRLASLTHKFQPTSDHYKKQRIDLNCYCLSQIPIMVIMHVSRIFRDCFPTIL